MQPQLEKRRQLSWALIRLTLGFLQITGAVASLVLLVETGVSTISLASVVLTGLFTTFSVLLFGRRTTRWPDSPLGRKGEYGKS
jgi:hypothetical protein